MRSGSVVTAQHGACVSRWRGAESRAPNLENQGARRFHNVAVGALIGVGGGRHGALSTLAVSARDDQAIPSHDLRLTPRSWAERAVHSLLTGSFPQRIFHWMSEGPRPNLTSFSAEAA
jgi:hypothetical protein